MASRTAKKKASAPVSTTGMTRMPLVVGPSGEAPATPTAGEPTKDRRPAAATAVTALMVAAGAAGIGVGVYWAAWAGSLLGGLLFLLIGGGYLYGGRGLQKGEGWGWGAGVFVGPFAIVLGLFVLPIGGIAIALALAILVLLLRVREYYGMVRYDPAEEERRNAKLRTARTENPGRLRCPHCGSAQLWIAGDGSAVCEDCRTGTIAFPPSA